jgi:hypothetical protein
MRCVLQPGSVELGSSLMWTEALLAWTAQVRTYLVLHFLPRD